MNKNNNIFERILQVIEFHNIKSVNIFAIKYLGYSSSEKINRLKNPNNKPSYEILLDISNKFENINMNWLINGTGEMLLHPISKLDEELAKDENGDKKPYKYTESESLYAAEEKAKEWAKENKTIEYLVTRLEQLAVENAELKKRLGI
jgi:hypothetical protein